MLPRPSLPRLITYPCAPTPEFTLTIRSWHLRSLVLTMSLAWHSSYVGRGCRCKYALGTIYSWTPVSLSPIQHQHQTPRIIPATSSTSQGHIRVHGQNRANNTSWESRKTEGKCHEEICHERVAATSAPPRWSAGSIQYTYGEPDGCEP